MGITQHTRQFSLENPPASGALGQFVQEHFSSDGPIDDGHLAVTCGRMRPRGNRSTVPQQV
jgi:hypothetical protein